MEVSGSMVCRGRVFAAVFAAVLLSMTGLAQADSVSDNAANWLISQQISSGSSAGAFPWKSGGSATTNTQGATALGLLRVYQRSGEAAYLDAATANGDCQLQGDACIPGLDYSSGHHHFATHDALFLEELSAVSGESQYAQFVDDELWSRLAAGTYGSSSDLTATGYANAVLASRTGQGYQELVAWDLSKLAIAAHVAGKSSARDAMMQAILASLNGSDASHTTFDIVGLAGAVWASAETGVDLDPTSGKWAAANSTADLAAMLINYQAPGGGFISDSSNAVADANTETQTTSFAMQALASVDSSLYSSQINSGFASIAAAQQPSGEYLIGPGYPPGVDGSVENQGETMEAYANIVLAADRWVASTGNDTGDCSDQNNPCQTIAYAIAQASNGNTIHIANGTYNQNAEPSPLTITKDGIKLVGEDPGNKPVITRSAGSINNPLLVIDGAKNVEVRDLAFGMDQSFVAEGILASGFVDGLVIDGNHFVNSRTSTGANSKYSWRNAIAVNHGNNSQGLPRVNGSTVTVSSNTIVGASDVANGVFLRAGIQVDASTGAISNNTVTTGVQDIQLTFATATSASSATTVSIDGNHTFGRGVDVSSPNASVTQITFSNNDIHAIAGIDDTTGYPADWSLLRLTHNQAGVPMTVSGNTFSGHEGSYRGVLVENFPGIAFNGNTFTPAAGAGDFVSLVVSNKEITSDNPPSAPLSMSLTAQGNTFNGSGVVGAGTAVEFLNDNDAGGSASFGSLIFGGSGSGQANNFDGDLHWYFHLDDYNCETATSCSYLDYSGVGSIPNTQARPFSGNVSAADNSFDGVMPSAMNAAQQAALAARTYDSSANSALGTVDYGLTAATITLDAGTLNATYDGNPQTVTATTNPSGLDYEVTYDGSTTAPTDVGSYAVVATITEPGYTVDSASGTLTVSKASGTVAWGPLNFTYDGNAKAVTASIAEESGTSCTVTPATVGPNVGNYAVSAVCTGSNYDASGSETATIDQATATLTLSDLTQTYDGSPKPVTVTSTPAGVSYSVTYNGSSTAPSAVGDYAVVATITDPNYSGDQASGVLHIIAADAPDLAVSITDLRDYAQYGHTLSYGIVVTNVGNTNITGATVNDVLPDTLLPMQPTSWHCYAGSGAGGSCASSSGSGDLSTTVDIPQNGSVTIILDTVVNDDQSLSTDVIQNQVTVSATGDTNAANDTDTDITQAVIFRDGFELDSDGAQVPNSVIGSGDGASLSDSNSQMLDLGSVWNGADGIVELARIRQADDNQLSVEALRVGKGMLVRMVGQVDGVAKATEWSRVKAGTPKLALALATSGQHHVLLLVGGAQDIQLKLSDGAATLQVWGPPTTDG